MADKNQFVRDQLKQDFGVLKKWTGNSTELEAVWQADLEKLVEYYVRKMINEHFEQLLHILYRVDVSEQKIKTLLRDNPEEDAAKMIAHLYVARILEKQKTREKYKSDEPNEWDM